MRTAAANPGGEVFEPRVVGDEQDTIDSGFDAPEAFQQGCRVRSEEAALDPQVEVASRSRKATQK